MKINNSKLSQTSIIINNSLTNLPSPNNINYIWNFGSLLGLTLLIQLITGILISMHFSPNFILAFSSVINIMKETENGWWTRTIHINGASLFFVCVFIHIFKGLNQSSFKNGQTWIRGISIFLILIVTAFLGYVLPWGQISFWGATVITNLFSTIPYVGGAIVTWLWGGFSVRNPTLNRFFSLHFLIPFILSLLIFSHLVFLHDIGSSNPSNRNSNFDKIEFKSFFISKDFLRFIIIILCLFIINLFNPNILGDPENYNFANPLVTPIHIQPEWYFLFAYAILRSIPNKLGGVISLLIRILIFYLFPLKTKKIILRKFNLKNKISISTLVVSFFTLTWIGANPVEPPYELIGKSFTIVYFFSLIYF